MAWGAATYPKNYIISYLPCPRAPDLLSSWPSLFFALPSNEVPFWTFSHIRALWTFWKHLERVACRVCFPISLARSNDSKIEANVLSETISFYNARAILNVQFNTRRHKPLLFPKREGDVPQADKPRSKKYSLSNGTSSALDGLVRIEICTGSSISRTELWTINRASNSRCHGSVSTSQFYVCPT